MASSRKLRKSEPPGDVVAGAVARFLGSTGPQGPRALVALSGGVDSVVLLHVLRRLAPQHRLELRAIHVHHGLSPNAGRWASFCRRYCRALGVPLVVRRVRVARQGRGLEAAAREARYRSFEAAKADALFLAHQLDDQAETVLLNLLRGTGARGASGMSAVGTLGAKALLRPLLEVSRASIVAYAKRHELAWIEDESNEDEALTRNFLRRRIGPLLAERFPRWKENLGRAARHIAAREVDANRLLREFLRERGLKAPSEAKLSELLRQLASGGARTAVRHDGHVVRVYRGEVQIHEAIESSPLAPVAWKGEKVVKLPLQAGELRFRLASRRGEGLDPARVAQGGWRIQSRRGGERLQPDPRRPRRTLKNLFQEAGVAPWERETMPLLYCGEELVWAPGLGIDWRYLARERRGLVPYWRRCSSRVASVQS